MISKMYYSFCFLGRRFVRGWDKQWSNSEQFWETRAPTGWKTGRQIGIVFSGPYLRSTLFEKQNFHFQNMFHSSFCFLRVAYASGLDGIWASLSLFIQLHCLRVFLTVSYFPFIVWNFCGIYSWEMISSLLRRWWIVVLSYGLPSYPS